MTNEHSVKCTLCHFIYYSDTSSQDHKHLLHRFHSEILASLNFNKNKIVSPGLENNHTLGWVGLGWTTALDNSVYRMFSGPFQSPQHIAMPASCLV